MSGVFNALAVMHTLLGIVLIFGDIHFTMGVVAWGCAGFAVAAGMFFDEAARRIRERELRTVSRCQRVKEQRERRVS